MTSYEATLAALDRGNYEVLEAITYGGFAPSSTHARPSKFVCADGRTYWAKGHAQQGLVAELIAGRVGYLIGACPSTRIINVPREALPLSGEADHLQGIVVGVQDIPDSQNARDLQPFIGRGEFDPNALDPASRPRVVAFQTWLGVRDEQVLIRFTDGVVFSIDHGNCFGATNRLLDPSITLTSIPHVPDHVGKDTNAVEAAAGLIEAITDRQILEAVAGVPTGDAWRSDTVRRLEIVEWLIYRRQLLRRAMEQWLRR